MEKWRALAQAPVRAIVRSMRPQGAHMGLVNTETPEESQATAPPQVALHLHNRPPLSLRALSLLRVAYLPLLLAWWTGWSTGWL